MSIQSQADIGVVGMAVMGQNLALNIESRGYTVAVYNRTQSTLHEFVQRAGDKRLVPAASLAEFAASLARPRKILFMVQAGTAVDRVIADLQPHLEPGDILIDGGNSSFVDTIRRARAGQRRRSCAIIGTGVSGGEEGALLGPSIMPGGDRDAYESVAPILTAIAAKVDGDPCCTYIGADGAGHYVKMVHNGIEYGDMQLIAEAYSFMKIALRHEPCRDARHVCRVEPRRAGLLPDRDYHRHSRQERPGNRRPHGRGDPGPGRTERHRQVDQRVRARPGRAGADHRRGGIRPLRVRVETGTGRRVGPAARPRHHLLRQPGPIPECPAPRALRLQDLLLRAGFQPDAGGGGRSTAGLSTTAPSP